MLGTVAKLLAICVMISNSPCSAQAPGDGNSRCINDPDAPTYPDNEKTLMDSYHYLQLLPGNGSGNIIPGAVWNDRSLDGNDEMNTINPTYWQQGAGGVCRFQVRVCGWARSGADQNNWLFTQHINKDFNSSSHDYGVQIRVQVIYALQSCRSRLGCDMGFRLLNYITDTQQVADTTGSGYMNIDNYNEFGRARPSSTTRSYFETFPFELGSSDTGFYVAIRDKGTCVGISRLRVYHYICPSQQVGLVRYDETPALVSDIDDVKVKCVKNATNYGSPLVTCHSNGTWGPENPVCKCDCGCEERQGECFKCPAGTYSLGNDTTCVTCPDNTVTSEPGACICNCMDDYFRYKADVNRPNVRGITWPSSDEGASVGCSKPPSAPRNLRLTDVQSTSITISWSQASDNGGRPDLYYQIEYFPTSDQNNRGVIYMPSTTTTYSITITSLKPYTQYTIRVSAHNGVSDQDPDRSQSRVVEQTNRTAEDVSGKVRDLQCFSRVLLWQAPAEPNGRIIDYELNYTRNRETKRVHTEGAQTFYLADLDSIPGDSGPFTVEVKARNGAGLGQSLCTLECDPDNCSPKPTTCRLCPGQQVGLVIYPDASAPEANTNTVATRCVVNAESVTSLDVTCDSSGNWGDENPQCSCKEGFTPSSNNQKCLGVGPPTNPPTDSTTDPATCLSCPEDIETVIDANCADVLIYWKPVSGAQSYKLQFHKKDDIFFDITVDEYIFKITLSDSEFKDKEMFIIEISADISDNSSKIEVDVMELTEECRSVSGRSEDSEDMDPLSLAIAIVVTFVVTALLVAFLATTIGLVVSARKKRSGGKGDTNGMHSTSPYPMRDYENADEMKSDLN